MSTSSGTTETLYHLSPAGWVPGSDPPDRIETWRKIKHPDASVSWRCAWVDPKRTTAERDALRVEYQAFMA
jgi:hypothetical protein